MSCLFFHITIFLISVLNKCLYIVNGEWFPAEAAVHLSGRRPPQEILVDMIYK